MSLTLRIATSGVSTTTYCRTAGWSAGRWAASVLAKSARIAGIFMAKKVARHVVSARGALSALCSAPGFPPGRFRARALLEAPLERLAQVDHVGAGRLLFLLFLRQVDDVFVFLQLLLHDV